MSHRHGRVREPGQGSAAGGSQAIQATDAEADACGVLPAACVELDVAAEATALASALGLKGLGPPVQSRVAGAELRALRLLAEQATRAIDYKTLGLGWDHPTDRLSYKEGAHPSFSHPASRRRSEESRKRLKALYESLVSSAPVDASAELVATFCWEIGAGEVRGTLAGVLSALEAELLMPLRALNEGGEHLFSTYSGHRLPSDRIAETVKAITSHVLDASFKEWRYSNPVGQRQLEGLSAEQCQLWSDPAASTFGDLRAHEDTANELGFFWATKIGGPSHGFDFEGQCILPLLANARHKVILVSDPSYPHHPVGRAHFRLLWVAAGADEAQQPVLWLEPVKQDFRAAVDARLFLPAVLSHAIARSEALGVMLSCEEQLEPLLQQLLRAIGERGASIRQSCDRLVLRPSNGVVEASDYLTTKHDWLQLEEETTEPLQRVVYVPGSAKLV